MTETSVWCAKPHGLSHMGARAPGGIMTPVSLVGPQRGIKLHLATRQCDRHQFFSLPQVLAQHLRNTDKILDRQNLRTIHG